MNIDLIMVIMGMVVLTINCTTMILTFPCKRGLPFTIGALLLFTAAFYTVLYLMGIIIPDNGGLPGLIYLPVMIWLFDGKLFQKVFAYFLQFLMTAFQVSLAEAVGGFFTRFGGDVSFIVFFAVLTLLFTAYIVLMVRFGQGIFEKLFVYGRPSEWALYSLGAIFAFTVLSATQIAPGSSWFIVLTLCFILWSFVVLCFAIINTNERSKQHYEVEFARDVISSGRDHYQKMDEMRDVLRILRHDYKYHLNVIHELLRSKDMEEIDRYLTDLESRLPEKELTHYCANSVINALLVSYAERCAKLDIKYGIEISMPGSIIVPNYEMCIVLGNLLENAVEACEQLEGVREIELIINMQGAHLAIMVKNSFDSNNVRGGGRSVSTKKDGGLGLRSVQAVAACYGGELMTERDEKTFTAYVLMRA